jgi:Sulfotransferase domain
MRDRRSDGLPCSRVYRIIISGLLAFVVMGYIRQQKLFLIDIHEFSHSKPFLLTLEDRSKASSFQGTSTLFQKYALVNKNQSVDAFSTDPSRLGPLTRLHSCTIHNTTHTFPEAPGFIIIGAQKAGSSALYDYLKIHPNILAPSNSGRDKELHFLDWLVPNRKERNTFRMEQNMTEEELWCYYRRKYANNFDVHHLRRRPLIAFEKTPSYMFLGYYLPDVLEKVCPWQPKLLAIVRNPIDRAWSHYNMAKTRHQLVSKNDRLLISNDNGTTFEELLDKEIGSLRKLQLSNVPYLKDSPNNTSWDTTLFALPILSKKVLDAAHDKHYREVFLSNYLQRGMYAIHLRAWKEQFGKKLLVLRYEDLYGQHGQTYYDLITDHIGVPRVPLPKSLKNHWSRQRYQGELSKRTRKFLRLFFEPYNIMLMRLMGKEWETSWS